MTAPGGCPGAKFAGSSGATLDDAARFGNPWVLRATGEPAVRPSVSSLEARRTRGPSIRGFSGGPGPFTVRRHAASGAVRACTGRGEIEDPSPTGPSRGVRRLALRRLPRGLARGARGVRRGRALRVLGGRRSARFRLDRVAESARRVARRTPVGCVRGAAGRVERPRIDPGQRLAGPYGARGGGRVRAARSPRRRARAR